MTDDAKAEKSGSGIFIAYFSFFIGAFVAAALINYFDRPIGSLNECRGANPGYECVKGYVKWEPFK